MNIQVTVEGNERKYTERLIDRNAEEVTHVATIDIDDRSVFIVVHDDGMVGVCEKFMSEDDAENRIRIAELKAEKKRIDKEIAKLEY